MVDTLRDAIQGSDTIHDYVLSVGLGVTLTERKGYASTLGFSPCVAIAFRAVGHVGNLVSPSMVPVSRSLADGASAWASFQLTTIWTEVCIRTGGTASRDGGNE